MTSQQEKTIHEFGKAERWKQRAAYIQRLLRSEPNNYCLLTELAMCYYEMRLYQKAFYYNICAMELNKNSPIVIWNMASSFDMLDRKEEAIIFWKELIKRGEGKLSKSGEGNVMWARSIINDSRYRIGLTYLRMKRNSLAKRYFESHFSNRKKGLFSLYPRSEVLKNYGKLKK